jgi:hypothetical protein
VVGGGGAISGLRLLLVFFAAAAAFATGCEDVNHHYVPLAVGNAWHYRVVSGERKLGTESLEVTARLKGPLTEDQGYRRFRVREPEGTAVWSEDARTIMRSSGKSFMTVIQHPPFVHSGWTDTAVDGSPVYCTVLRRQTVTVPAGSFEDCIVVSREAANLSSVVTQWFAPDVGLVKWRVSGPRRPTIEWHLTSYRARVSDE